MKNTREEVEEEEDRITGPSGVVLTPQRLLEIDANNLRKMSEVLFFLNAYGYRRLSEYRVSFESSPKKKIFKVKRRKLAQHTHKNNSFEIDNKKVFWGNWEEKSEGHQWCIQGR